MFLKELTNGFHKIMFMECACLIVMADGSKETTSQEIRDMNIKSYSECIDDDELKMLKEYAQELDSGSSNKGNDEFSLFLKEIFRPSAADLVFGSLFGGSGGNNRDSTLSRVVEDKISEVVKEYGDNKIVKQEVTEKIVLDGLNIAEFDVTTIQQLMANLPELKKIILERSVKHLIESKQEHLTELTSREKKIILCELIGVGLCNGHLETLELFLIEKICDLLDIDSGYIDEFKQTLEHLLNVNRELTDLINE